MVYYGGMDTTSQSTPSVSEANTNLRRAANDAVAWMNIMRLKLPVADSVALGHRASALQAAVKASNDALDAEAFGGPVNVPHVSRESRA